LLQSTSSAHARFAPYSTPSLNTHTHLTALCPVPESKTNLDFTEARNSEWQWHQSGCMQVCTSLQTDNHASTPPLSFLHRMPFLPPNQQRQSTEEKTPQA